MTLCIHVVRRTGVQGDIGSYLSSRINVLLTKDKKNIFLDYDMDTVSVIDKDELLRGF